MQDRQICRAMDKQTNFLARMAYLCYKYLAMLCNSQPEGKYKKFSIACAEEGFSIIALERLYSGI